MPIATRRQAQARSRITHDGSPTIETPTAQMSDRNGASTTTIDQDMEDEAPDVEEDEEVQGKLHFLALAHHHA